MAAPQLGPAANDGLFCVRVEAAASVGIERATFQRPLAGKTPWNHGVPYLEPCPVQNFLAASAKNRSLAALLLPTSPYPAVQRIMRVAVPRQKAIRVRRRSGLAER